MSIMGSIVTISPRDFDAVLFDLDGVLTQTESVHASSWVKNAFNERCEAEINNSFDRHDVDYGELRGRRPIQA